MASVRRRDYAQRVEHAEHAVDVACFLVGVAHVWDSASAQAADPGYAWVAAINMLCLIWICVFLFNSITCFTERYYFFLLNS